MELTDVREVFVAKSADDCNQKLLYPDWKLLEISVGMRRVHHAGRVKDEQPYDFEVPYTTFVLGRVP